MVDAGSAGFADAGLNTRIFFASFQDGGLPPISVLGRSQVAADSLEVVTAPWDANRKALKVLVRIGEMWNGNNYPRSEVYPYVGNPSFTKFQFGTRYRITSAFWFEPNTIFPTSSVNHPGTGEVVIFQMHGSDAVSPVFAFQVNAGELQLGFLPDPTAQWQTHSYGPCPVGQRIPIEVIFQPSISSDGYVKVTIGTQVVFEFSGPNHAGPRVNNDAGGFWVQGIYDYWRSVGALPGTADDSLTIYQDDISVYR